MKKTFLVTVLCFCLLPNLFAQDDLMKMLEEESKKQKKKEFATATFKTTRLINGQSIENVAAG
ncbi:MAG TPA: hypothetical protein PKM83_04640, partial [Ferruginibacter sp.]|nr:hypothetical protein [Ferruginibacter sp.]